MRAHARSKLACACARAHWCSLCALTRALCAHVLEQAPGDAACYAYFEGNGTFAFWGPDSILQLTGLTPRPAN